MSRIYELRQKEVINTSDGCRFGYICDLDVNTNNGTINKIIIPGPGKVFGMFGREQEYHIPWECVKQIGDDIILVDIDTKKALIDTEYK